MIEALTHRYNGTKALDPAEEAPVLAAYAKAMERVAARFPKDPDVRVIAAEAMMTANAWKLWTFDGKPAPGTAKIIANLEAVLAMHPAHPGANHYYIHAVEASPNPDRAIPAARRLGALMPAAGHLVHMPAHIWQRVGEYEEAARANRRAIAADAAYYRLTKPLDYYAMYTAHNIQFLAYAASMEGRKGETISAMRRALLSIPDDLMLAMPGTDWYQAQLYQAFLRFGMWREMLDEPAPNPTLKAQTAGFLYGRAVALIADGRAQDAKPLLEALEKAGEALAPDDGAGLNSAKDIVALAATVLRARLAAATGHETDAIALLRDAVAKEDTLAYDEPADWFIPVRQQLGAALLKAGQAKQAEAVYREDLRRHRDNGWSMLGLAQTLKAQGRSLEAASAQAAFKKAWANADIVLTASAF